MDTLFVRVKFADGAQRTYAILQSMPVANFREAVAARVSQPITGVEFLHDPADLPAVAELLPMEL